MKEFFIIQKADGAIPEKLIDFATQADAVDKAKKLILKDESLSPMTVYGPVALVTVKPAEAIVEDLTDKPE